MKRLCILCFLIVFTACSSSNNKNPKRVFASDEEDVFKKRWVCKRWSKFFWESRVVLLRENRPPLFELCKLALFDSSKNKCQLFRDSERPKDWHNEYEWTRAFVTETKDMIAVQHGEKIYRFDREEDCAVIPISE
jgi:hypothetical protein